LTIKNTKPYPISLNQNVYSYKITNQSSFQENSFFQDKSRIPKSPNLRPTQNTKDDFTKREMLLSNILDKIAPKYEEIRNLLSHIPEPTKTQIVGGIISRALYTDDPIRFINNQLKDLRKAKFYNIMLDDASIFLGFDKQSTKEYLKMGLKEDAMD
jgi:hypothetical protein